MSEEKQRYHSFLLRLWQVKENEHTVWRASLESSHTGERWGFANVEALFEFVRQEIGAAYEAGEGDGKTVNVKRSVDFEILCFRRRV
jgi:hypothetical protein